MARHSFQDSQKCHVPPICLGREELVTLGQWDQGKVFGILYLRLSDSGIQEEAGPLGEEFAQGGLAP